VIFQTLDDKKECIGIYADDKLNFNEIPADLTRTWSYSPYLKGLDIEYANLYCEGKNLEDICPDIYKQELEYVNNKLIAYINSFISAKVSLKENCFFYLIPKSFLKQYCNVKNKICEHIFNTYKKPEEYAYFSRFNELITDIKFRNLNIDVETMKDKISNNKDIVQYRKLLDTETNISYNLFGSITGRLSTKKNSFPILNFAKSLRNVLKPHNDWFVSFDINAAELRTSLALLEKDQPDGDLYDMFASSVYENKYSRKEIKEATTAWLYNSNNEIATQYSEKLDNVFEKENLLNSYWDGKYVHTPFYRKIESDKFHAIPYLNQSTFIDLFHRQVIKVDDYLQDKKSFIPFLLHDEFVIDMTDDEKENIIDIVKIIQDTQFGKFIVNVKVGKDYGNMKKLKLKV